MDELKKFFKKTSHFRIQSIQLDTQDIQQQLAPLYSHLPFESQPMTEHKWRCVDIASTNPHLPFFVNPSVDSDVNVQQRHFEDTFYKKNPSLSLEDVKKISEASTAKARRAYLNHFWDLEQRMSGPLTYREGLPSPITKKLNTMREHLHFDRVILTEMLPGCEMSFHSHFEFDFDRSALDYSHLLVHLPLTTNDQCDHEVLVDEEVEKRHYPSGQFWIFNSWLKHRAVNLGNSVRQHLIFFIDIQKNERFLYNELSLS